MDISSMTKSDIVAYLLQSEHPFHGNLDIVSFLKRIWDLSSMKSTDPRHSTAAGDIHQHMISFNDWDNSFLLYDYMKILESDDAKFLLFLETCLHPLVVSDDGRINEMLTFFNAKLEPDGYQIRVVAHRLGRPLFKAEQKEGSQQNDKGLASTAIKSFVFYKLVHELLLNLGYRVVVEPRGADTGVDFLAYYPGTSKNGITSERSWVVEVKYRNLAGTLGVDPLRQFYAYSKSLNTHKALLVTNLNLSAEAQLFATKSNELEIWDSKKLLALLEQFPELKQKYSDVVSQLDKPTLSGTEGLGKPTLGSQHELIQALKALPTGDGKAYEELVKRILEFCFYDEFSPFTVKEQVNTYNKKRIRDFIIDNRSPKVEFWQSLKWVRKVEKILFDAKNYKNPVEYREILDTLRYLKNGAFGNFIIIISRKGIKDYEEALEDYSDTQQIALFLSDEDLEKMIFLKIKGESPTLLIEDKYFDFLDKK